MSTNPTTWHIQDPISQVTEITDVQTAVPPATPVGTIVKAFHPTFGSGEFIFLKGVASTAAGDVVEIDTYTPATVRWAGTANSGKPLGIAMAAIVASSYGWYQISGAATVNIGGAVVAGNPVYFQATAVVDDAAVNGKQVLGATFLTTAASGTAVVQINRPHCQGQTV